MLTAYRTSIGITEVLILVAVLLLGYFAGRYVQYNRYRRPRLQNYGEALVSEAMTKTFLSPDYHLLNNLTLSSRDGTTQVDHVLVSRFGIFVIETKHYTGWIFGDANAPAWTQVIYLKKSSFQNPIRQNYKHIKSIQLLLDFMPPEHVHSAVVFTGDAEFQTARPEGVFTLDGLIAYVRGFTEEVMSVNRMQFCVGRLECCRFSLTRETDVDHRESLNRRFGDSN